LSTSREKSVVELWARRADPRVAKPLAPEVIERAKAALLDYLGVAVGGATADVVLALDALGPDSEDPGAALRIGRGRRALPSSAALANAAAGHALELDDGCRAAAGHPGTVVIPAALAVARTPGCDGQRILRAIVLGYEVFIGLGTAVNPAHLRRGFHTTATVGPLAAAMAAAVAAGHDEAAIARSLSLAGLMGAGLMEVTVDGATAKPVQVGQAAAAGVSAALLAARGIGGPRRVVEGDNGFLRAMSGADASGFRPAIDTDEWLLERAYVKRHACCRHAHAAIDAALELRERIGAGRLATATELNVSTYEAAARICGGPTHPKSVEDARFSIPFTVALAIRNGGAGPTAFSSAALDDPVIAHLAERISVHVDGRLESLYPDERGAAVSALFSRGRVEREEMLHPKGEPENPLSSFELEDKFLSTAALGGLPRDRATALRRQVADLDRLDRGSAVLAPLESWVA
jgi:2-methylcitrate dehydratase PrpD